VWVTDENGQEIPTQTLRQIDAVFNGQTRLSLTGFQARHMQGPSLPHPFVENTRSENLYALSYFSGRRSAGGLEDGVNFSRIDTYGLRLQFEEWVPEHFRFQVHVLHRSQNTLRFSTGRVNMLYHMANQPIVVEAEPMLVAAPPFVLDGPERRLQALVFPNAEQDIAVPDSEPQCMITFEDIVEGATVERCRACRKIFSASGIFQWLRLRQQPQWICAHCRGTYGVDHFDRGVARLGPAATAAAPTRTPPRPKSLATVAAVVAR
jgi:hypothetical protein